MAKFSLFVRPGSPDVPEFVDIKCSGMDSTKTIEFIINDVVRDSGKVDRNGNVDLTYTASDVDRKAELVDLNSCSGQVLEIKETFCRIKTGLGDSMELRYQS